MKRENKIVSLELAKRLKDLGFNVPVSSCYTKELHYTDEYCTDFIFDWVLRNHIITEYETRDRDYGVGDEEEKWVKIYFENYYDPEKDSDDCVNWNINTYELHLEYCLDGKDLKTTDPERWEKRLRPYCTEEWYRTAPRDEFIKKEKYLYETILESQDEDWIYFFGLSPEDLHTEYDYKEIGVEFSFPMKEYMSAPDILDVITWLKNEYNIDINITTTNGLTYDGEGIWDKNIKLPRIVGEDSWIGCFEKMVDLIVDFIIVTKE